MIPILAACLLLHNATVIDPASSQVRRGTDVVVEEGRIASVGAARACERTVDLTGKYLLPGFSDLHAHLWLHPYDEKGELASRWDRPSIEQMLRTLLASGVTTIRDPGAETEAAVALRTMLHDGKVVGPELLTCGRILNDSDFNAEPFQPTRDAAAVRREIAWQKAAGVDCIKVYASMRPPLLKIAVDEAHAAGLPIIGHLQRTTWSQAAELGIDGVEHPAWWSPEGGDMFSRVTWLESLDESDIKATAATLAKHHVFVDPTLIAIETKFFGDEHLHDDVSLAPALHTRGWPAGMFTKGWTPAQYAEAHKAWPKLLAITKALQDAGVVLTVGTDMPGPWIVPGASVAKEMALLHDAGLSNMDVLRAATSNAALSLRKSDRGAVRAGMRADLVVLRADPLADIRNTAGVDLVVRGGVVFEPRELLSH